MSPKGLPRRVPNNVGRQAPLTAPLRIPYYQVNAFAPGVFGGNPAGVCFLDQWLSDNALLRIAAENNHSETAFLVRDNDYFHLRWFTPVVEVSLCGHATLASAFVLFSELHHPRANIRFHTQSGWLEATRRGDLVEIDLPARPPAPCEVPEALAGGLGRQPAEVLKSRDYLAVFETQREVEALDPDFEELTKLDCLGIIATAPGANCDFVSRFFAPGAGVPEDPVTGSAHCTLIPFWAGRLKKTQLFARQVSRRSGELWCRHLGNRVGIGGRAIVYNRGEIEIPNH